MPFTAWKHAKRNKNRKKYLLSFLEIWWFQYRVWKKVLLQQSHYREVPQWGVSNGARHNWKCFLAYIWKFFQNHHMFFNTLKCATNHVMSFEVYGCFMVQKILKLWRQQSWPFCPNPVQISHRATSLSWLCYTVTVF